MNDHLSRFASRYKYLCGDDSIHTWDELTKGLASELMPKDKRSLVLFLSCFEAKPIIELDVCSWNESDR